MKITQNPLTSGYLFLREVMVRSFATRRRKNLRTKNDIYETMESINSTLASLDKEPMIKTRNIKFRLTFVNTFFSSQINLLRGVLDTDKIKHLVFVSNFNDLNMQDGDSSPQTLIVKISAWRFSYQLSGLNAHHKKVIKNPAGFFLLTSEKKRLVYLLACIEGLEVVLCLRNELARAELCGRMNLITQQNPKINVFFS